MVQSLNISLILCMKIITTDGDKNGTIAKVKKKHSKTFHICPFFKAAVRMNIGQESLNNPSTNGRYVYQSLVYLHLRASYQHL